MSLRLHRRIAHLLAWLPLAVAAQGPVGATDGTATDGTEIDPKVGSVGYLAGFDALFRLDLTSGAGTLIGNGFGFASGAQVADMDSLAFAPDGTLYGVADSPRAALYRLSTVSGRATLVAQLRENGQLIDAAGLVDGAIGFTCSGKLLLASRGLGRLFEVDPATATVRSLGPLDVAVGAIAAHAGELFALGVGGNTGVYRLAETGAAISAIPNTLASRSYPAGALAFGPDGRLFAAFDNNRQAPPVLLELSPDGATVLRETTITGPQFGTGANSQPVRALAIAPPVCAPAGSAVAVAVPSLDLRGLAALALLLAVVGWAVRRRAAI